MINARRLVVVLVAVHVGSIGRRRQRCFAFGRRRGGHPGGVTGESQELAEVIAEGSEVQHRDRAGSIQVNIFGSKPLIRRHVRVGVDRSAEPVTKGGKVQHRDRTAAVPVTPQHEQAVVLAADQRERGATGQRRFEFQLIHAIRQLIRIQVDRQFVSIQHQLIVTQIIDDLIGISTGAGVNTQVGQHQISGCDRGWCDWQIDADLAK